MSILLLIISTLFIFAGIIIAILGAKGAYGGDGIIDSTPLSIKMFKIFLVTEATGFLFFVLAIITM